jgi:hypothetical protein
MEKWGQETKERTPQNSWNVKLKTRNLKRTLADNPGVKVGREKTKDKTLEASISSIEQMELHFFGRESAAETFL